MNSCDSPPLSRQLFPVTNIHLTETYYLLYHIATAYYAAQSVLAGSWDSHGKLASTSTELRILGISSQQCQIVKEMVIQLFLERE